MTVSYHFDTSQVKWTHLEGGDDFDYPIDYEIAVLGSQPDIGTLDLLIRFAPNSHCHFHRHVAATTILVLEGEQHLVDIGPDGSEVGRKVRHAGAYAHSPGGDIHMERGGPDGALVFFGLVSPSGVLFESLDADLNVMATSTVEDMAKSFATE